MRKAIFATLIIIMTLLFSPRVRGMDGSQAPDTPGRKKVGLVLSGGGAKGTVHVGVIKVLEEAGIPIDYIGGTSMGAIIGGLYAAGYDTQTLDSLLRAQNWPDLFSDRVPRRNLSIADRETSDRYLLTVPLSMDRKLRMPSGLMSGTKVLNLLHSLTIDYKDTLSFTDLPIPFACVAYDLGTGKTVTLDHGNLATAIRASMSIPGAFEPVRIDSMVLIDGGIANNFPSDIVKAMGADILIGVDVAAGDKISSEITDLMDMFNQITWYAGIEAYDRNREDIDLYIHPDIEGYTAASFMPAAIDTLLVRGERAARDQWDDIMELRKQIGLPEDYSPPKREKIDFNKQISIGGISFEGNRSYTDKILLRVSGLKGYSDIHPYELQAAVSRLQGVRGLKDVYFQLEGESPYSLIFNVKEGTRSFLSVGVRFDTEEMAAILLNSTIGFTQFPHAGVEVTARLSENPYGKVSLIMGNDASRRFALSYRFKYNNIDIYEYGDKVSNLDFSHQTADFSYSSLFLRHFKATLGLKFDYYYYYNMFTSAEFELARRSERLIGYYASAKYESLDDRYTPRRGLSFNADYTLYTTDFYSNWGHKPFSSVDVDFLGAISVSKRVTFLPGFFGRVIIGENIPFPALNMVGGTVDGRYMPQQIRFTGINRFELFDHSVVGVRFDTRVRLWRKHYVSARSNYAKHANDFWDLPDGRDVWGVGIGWDYVSVIGPISLQVDYSNRTGSVGVYANIGYYF